MTRFTKTPLVQEVLQKGAPAWMDMPLERIIPGSKIEYPLMSLNEGFEPTVLYKIEDSSDVDNGRVDLCTEGFLYLTLFDRYGLDYGAEYSKRIALFHINVTIEKNCRKSIYDLMEKYGQL